MSDTTTVGYPRTIAIDGPAASGKTTLGDMLATRLGYVLLDTGVMYRVAALAALEAGIDMADEPAVVALTEAVDMAILPLTDPPTHDDERRYTVLLNGRDVTWAIREPRVARNVSLVASYKGVRDELTRRQREIGAQGNVVMVGRDIGTVVLPDAPLKLYIVASAEERAQRRLLDEQARGREASYEQILADVVRRDELDSSRTHAPLKPAEDAILIDTTGRTPAVIMDDIWRAVVNLRKK